MPNGVICGGAVDGSNHVGAIVTCHAITASPEGVTWARAMAAMPIANSAAAARARWRRYRRSGDRVSVMISPWLLGSARCADNAMEAAVRQETACGGDVRSRRDAR